VDLNRNRHAAHVCANEICNMAVADVYFASSTACDGDCECKRLQAAAGALALRYRSLSWSIARIGQHAVRKMRVAWVPYSRNDANEPSRIGRCYSLGMRSHTGHCCFR